MQRLERKRPEFFPAKWSSGRVRSFVRDPAPVAAWHIEGKMRRDGRAMATDYASGIDYQRTIEPGSRKHPICPASFPRRDHGCRRGCAGGPDADTIGRLCGDARFRADRSAGLAASTTPTILHIIDAPMGSEVPLTMTEWDFSFLKALYSSDGRNYAASQRSEMRKLVKQELGEAQAAGE